MRVLCSYWSRTVRNGLRKTQSVRTTGPQLSGKAMVSTMLLAGGTIYDADCPHLILKADTQHQRSTIFPGLGIQTLATAHESPKGVLIDLFARAKQGIERCWERDGGPAIIALTAANVGVYVLWKTAPTALMVRHFANSLETIRKGRVWTSLTSNFSHMGLFHLGSNMYLLGRFGPDVAEILGDARFCLFYAASGIASSLTSLTLRRLTKSNVLSLGASGSVVAILWLYACFFPERRMRLIMTEQSITMQELVLAYTVIDAAGLLGSFGKIDFAAHLGGAAFSNVWFYSNRDQLVREERSRQKNRNRKSLKGVAMENGNRGYG